MVVQYATFLEEPEATKIKLLTRKNECIPSNFFWSTFCPWAKEEQATNKICGVKQQVDCK